MNVLQVGEHAVLCEVEDPSTVHRLRAAILRGTLPGVVDVVPGLRTVLVMADSAAAADNLRELLPQLSLPPLDNVAVNEHVIPVVYDGPDLDAVAEYAGLSVDEVVRRHAGATYTVAFLGFQPGFPYLVGLDPALATPRRHTPRTDVPSGSVGIAGDLTGIYPRSSPGGWQLIGLTDTVLFDVTREPPAFLAPGDTVRFVS